MKKTILVSVDIDVLESNPLFCGHYCKFQGIDTEFCDLCEDDLIVDLEAGEFQRCKKCKECEQ